MLGLLCVPVILESGICRPIFEGAGARSDSANYRPISLLPVISKIFEYFVNQQLLGFLEDDLLNDCQYGFRHFHSTGDLLSVITDHFNMALDRRGEARVVALDISKAFDKVWHTGLLHKTIHIVCQEEC